MPSLSPLVFSYRLQAVLCMSIPSRVNPHLRDIPHPTPLLHRMSPHPERNQGFGEVILTTPQRPPQTPRLFNPLHHPGVPRCTSLPTPLSSLVHQKLPTYTPSPLHSPHNTKLSNLACIWDLYTPPSTRSLTAQFDAENCHVPFPTFTRSSQPHTTKL